jgi:hypothetical protein
MRSVSPISRPSLSAVLMSSETSSGDRGGRPSTVVRVSNGSGDSELTKLGAKPGVIFSPSSSTNWATEKIAPAALSTPSTSRTRSRNSAGKGGAVMSSELPRVVGATATSVPA